MREMNFWSHLDELRLTLIRCGIVVVALTVAFFVAMPQIFDAVLLAPCSSNFILYRWIAVLNSWAPILPDFVTSVFEVKLISINLTSQFFIQMSTACFLGVVFAFPFIVYQLWRYVSAALYEFEKQNARKAFILGNLLFFIGIGIGYLLVFPLTLRFLATYQISASIVNQITIDSYVGTLISLIFIMGIVFEMPLLCWLLSKMGLLSRSFFSKYRRYAVVILLLVAAIITPSGDPFTLMVVFLPVYMLYEISALLVAKR